MVSTKITLTKQTEDINKQLQAIGKQFFINHFEALQADSPSDIDLVRRLTAKHNYAFAACRVRVNKARKLLRNYNRAEILKVAVEHSPSINPAVLSRAKVLLTQFDKTWSAAAATSVNKSTAKVRRKTIKSPSPSRNLTLAANLQTPARAKQFRALRHNSLRLLPNLFTLCGLFFGFLSIVLSMRNAHIESMICIALAAFFDGMDGKIARLTNSSSRLGVELDSIADMVSFGVAPAIFLLSNGFDSLGNVGWAVCFFYVVAAALRLARFNTLASEQHATDFLGLPSPAAAGIVVLTFMMLEYLQLPSDPFWRLALALIITLLVSLSMTSSMSYRNIRSLFAPLRPFWKSVIVAVLLALTIAEPFVFPCLILLLYWLVAPGIILVRRVRRSVSAT